MPEDYEGHPQRRDFPIGGEPVLFTHHEAEGRDYTVGTNVEPQR
jgi:NADH-quinone oxidoreductase subunit C